MRLEREMHWPCGFQRRDAIRSWRGIRLPLASTDCPLHGRLCPTPIAPSLRQRLRQLQNTMYDLKPGALHDEVQSLLDEALGPWQLPEEATEGG